MKVGIIPRLDDQVARLLEQNGVIEPAHPEMDPGNPKKEKTSLVPRLRRKDDICEYD